MICGGFKGHVARLLDSPLVALLDEDGLTADELAARLDMDRWSIQPHTSELKRKGLIPPMRRRRRAT